MRDGGAAATSSRTRYGECRDALVPGEFRSNVKVHVVASIVAVDIENTLATVHGLGDRQDKIGSRGGEHLAARRTIRQVITDIAVEQRLVTAAAADQQGHLAIGDTRLAQRIGSPRGALCGRRWRAQARPASR